MNVFVLLSEVDTCQHFNLVDGGAYLDPDPYESPNAEPLGPTWVPVRLKLENKELPLTDTPGLLPSCPVFSRRAVDALRPLLEANAEILPVDCQDGEYYLINVTRVIDALDAKRTRFQDYPDGTTGRILEHAFLLERLSEATIFKLPIYASEVYVTERFTKAVRDAGLTGFKFIPT